METALDALKNLHASLVDTRHGYEEACKDGPEPDLLPTLERMTVMHAAAASQIAAMLAALGAPADDQGSFMSTVNRAVIGLRALITGLGENILPALASGEEVNIAKYDAVLASAELGPSHRAVILAQRDALESAIARMKSTAAT